MMKLLKNKIFLTFVVICDVLICLLGLYLCENKLMYIGLIIFLHFMIILLVFKLILKVPLINFKKIRNYYYLSEKRKQLKDDELYMSPLDIKTFDGSGSLTHPSILYFENGYNKYRFWMVFTPYDNNNVQLENPCIVVSNDGIHFEKLKGVSDPLLPIIEKKKPYTFYNDPYLLYTDRLELWYRYTVEGDVLINDVYRICSNDGVNWTKPELMIKSDGLCYMSLSIIYFDYKYYMYYFDMDYQFNMKVSKDLKKWSDEKVLNVAGFTGKFWHGEAMIIQKQIWLLFVDKKYNLYIAKSDNGIDFGNLQKLKVYYNPNNYLYKEQIIYKSTMLVLDDKVYLYIPIRFTKVHLFRLSKVFHKKWKLTLTLLNKENFNKIMKE